MFKTSINKFLSGVLLVFAFTVPVGLAAAQTTGAAVFKAGTGRRDITPKEGVPMWGYGERHDALSQGTLDPLYAAALVLQIGDKKLAIVGLDLGRSPAEHSLQSIRQRIKEAGIEYSFIAGSHTHHGPVLELTDEPGKGQGRFDASLRYYKQMEDGIVGAILDANASLVPARMGTGSIQLEGYNRNRHTKIEPRPSDRELAVMRLDDMTGKPIAIVVNWAAHPTNIPAMTLKFSADYVGALKAEIEKETAARAIFMEGASGDQSTNLGKMNYIEYGQALAHEAVKVADAIKTEPVEHPSLEVKEERFTFKPRIDISNPIVRVQYEKAFFPELIPNFIDEYKDGVRPRLTVALLNGNIALVGVSGEFFSNHAIRLKQRARVKQLFFFGYSNGYHQYFPTIEAVAEGGYGADFRVSPVAIGAGEQMMNQALIWIYEMMGQIKQ
ncbi:MAG: neutral/alkaline non-lysosomal ceramidase N-terminal domain-containing protein [Blastocatellia bacterium]